MDVKHHVYLLYAAADGDDDDDDDDDDDVGLNVLRCRADSIVISCRNERQFYGGRKREFVSSPANYTQLQTLGLAAAGRLVGAKYSQCTPPNANTKTRLSATATATPN